jgi:two-component system nitrogen regulation response regulator NtrX
MTAQESGTREWLEGILPTRRILLVEDDSGVRRMFQSFAQDYRAKIDEAESLEEGREKIRENEYDLVFLDIILPDGSGIDLFKEIVETKPNLPAQIISGFIDSEMMDEVQKIGSAGFVRKPNDFTLRFFSHLFARHGILKK